jgi:hypothetical protein
MKDGSLDFGFCTLMSAPTCMVTLALNSELITKHKAQSTERKVQSTKDER